MHASSLINGNKSRGFHAAGIYSVVLIRVLAWTHISVPISSQAAPRHSSRPPETPPPFAAMRPSTSGRSTPTPRPGPHGVVDGRLARLRARASVPRCAPLRRASLPASRVRVADGVGRPSPATRTRRRLNFPIASILAGGPLHPPAPSSGWCSSAPSSPPRTIPLPAVQVSQT